MAGFDRDDVAANPLPEEREVADDIEDFVPDEFVGKAQWFLAQDGFAADHDRVLEAAALDQVLVHEVSDVIVENESPRRRDFTFVDGGGDFGGKKLRELTVRSRLGARDSEFRVGQNNEERSGFRLDVDRLSDIEEPARRFLRDDPRFLDQLDIGP